ncbi:unnamed protein product [Protopolystoma xenopodis]|uniref:Uncharacterized protein n=1 Tax=Protopolystoma xenopodis TaxID=117903 RepID=A0A448X623_9PLAT|nr:unnamed protein product [Protopolystoma xenopodis]
MAYTLHFHFFGFIFCQTDWQLIKLCAITGPPFLAIELGLDAYLNWAHPCCRTELRQTAAKGSISNPLPKPAAFVDSLRRIGASV